MRYKQQILTIESRILRAADRTGCKMMLGELGEHL
jgi:hypothetical protein